MIFFKLHMVPMRVINQKAAIRKNKLKLNSKIFRDLIYPKAKDKIS